MTKLKKIPTPTYMYTNKWNNTVKKVEITRQTDFSVFFKNGGRCFKTTQDCVYKATKQKVLDWIENELRKTYDHSMRRATYSKGQLDKFLEYKKEVENDTSI